MKGRVNISFWLTFLGTALTVLSAAGYLYLMQRSPLEFKHMDFDQNGFVTFSELAYAASYGTRKITKHQQSCVEYYALKDGLRLKLDCNGNAP